MGLNKRIVKCYSGHTYAEEPLSFERGGVKYEVDEIKKAWVEPGERRFLVRTGDNKSFKLCYNEAEDRWSIIEVGRS